MPKGIASEKKDERLYWSNGKRRFIIDEDLDPWERQPGEPQKAFNDFNAYLLQNPRERSIRNTVHIIYKGRGNFETNRQNIKTKCRRYKWVERAIAYDSHIAKLERAEWERRRLEVRELDFQQTMKLRKLLDEFFSQMDGFFVDKETYVPGKDGEPDKLIINRQPNVQALTKALQTVSDVGRRAVGDTTENIQISATGLNQLIANELKKLAEGTGEDIDEEEEIDDAEIDEDEPVDVGEDNGEEE